MRALAVVAIAIASICATTTGCTANDASSDVAGATTTAASGAVSPGRAVCPDEGSAPLSPLPRPERAWGPGTFGEIAGFSPGGELFFDDPETIERELDETAATGARWLRLDLDWSYLEPEPGTFAWCRSDPLVLGALERGLDVLAVPGFAPRWAGNPDAGEGLHPGARDPADYAAFVRAAAERYAPVGVRTWELWNEPNVRAFWRPNPDVAQYAATLEAGYAAIKEVDPGATVLSGGLAPVDDADDGHAISIETFVRGLLDAGADRSFDGIAVHPYFSTFDRLPALHELLVEMGLGDKPLWLTEYGVPTGYGSVAVTDDVQADRVTDVYRTVAGWDWAGPLLWYTLRDLGTDLFDPNQNWGLMRRNFTPKPAHTAFVALAREERPGA